MNTQRVEGHTPIAWITEESLKELTGPHRSEYVAKLTRAEQSSYGFKVPLYSAASIERLEKVNEALVRALEEVSQVLTVEEHQNPGKGWGDFLEKDVLPALRLAKEPT